MLLEITTKREALLAIGMGLVMGLLLLSKLRHWADVRRLKKSISDKNKTVSELTSMEAVVNFRRKQKGLPPKYTKV